MIRFTCHKNNYLVTNYIVTMFRSKYTIKNAINLQENFCISCLDYSKLSSFNNGTLILTASYSEVTFYSGTPHQGKYLLLKNMEQWPRTLDDYSLTQMSSVKAKVNGASIFQSLSNVLGMVIQ